MTRGLKILGWVLFAAALISALLIAAAVAALGAFGPAVIEIDGQRILLSDLSAGQGLAALLGLMLAVLIVPVALIVPLLLVGLVLGGVLLVAIVVALGAAAFALSPLIVLAALAWWIWRRRRADRPAGAPRNAAASAAATPGATIVR